MNRTIIEKEQQLISSTETKDRLAEREKKKVKDLSQELEIFKCLYKETNAETFISMQSE